MTETENIDVYPTAQKQMYAAGTAFRILSNKTRDFWGTGYQYYLDQKAAGKPVRPLLGRFKSSPNPNEEPQFQIYSDGSWQDKDITEFDYVNEKNKTKNYFENKKELLCSFKTPITIELWDKETSRTKTEQHQVAWVRMSKSLLDKILKHTETISKMGANPFGKDAPFFMIKYNGKLAPAEQYQVEFIGRE